MRKRQSVKVVKYMVIVPIIVLFLSILTSGADPGTSQRSNHSTSQPEQTSKIAQVPSKPVTVSPSSFRPEMPFAEAINILRNSTRPPLNIAVLWKDLEENADIFRDTPIGIDGLSNVSLRMHLKSLLMGVSGGSPVKLGYIVDDGVIIIATRDSLPTKMTARVYDVTDLVAPPANYFFFFPSPGIPFGGLGSFGPTGGFGYQGAGSGIYPGGSYGYGNGLTGLIQNQYGIAGRSFGNYPARPTR